MILSYTRILYFLTIVKHMNMKKAADELFISQPALSLSIAKFEDELGITLLYRDRNKLIVSSEAEKLIPQFEKIRNDFNDLDNLLDAIKKPVSEFVNVSFSGSNSAFHYISQDSILEHYKSGTVKLSFVDHEQATTMLLNGMTQFAISYPPIQHPSVTSEIIFEESFGVAMPLTNPLSKLNSLELTDLEKLEFHGLGKNHLSRRVIDEVLSDNCVYPKYATENRHTEYLSRIFNCVGNTCFFSTKNHFEVNFAPTNKYKFIPVNCDDLVRRVGLSYLTEGKSQFEHKDLLKLLRFETIDTYKSLNQKDSSKL